MLLFWGGTGMVNELGYRFHSLDARLSFNSLPSIRIKPAEIRDEIIIGYGWYHSPVAIKPPNFNGH